MSMKKAFTLVELLIVIVLIGLIASLTLANVTILPTENNRTPKGVLTAALKEARIDAASRGADLSMFFDEKMRDIVLIDTFTGEEIWRKNILCKKFETREVIARDANGKEYMKEERVLSEGSIDDLQKVKLAFYPFMPEVINFAAVGGAVDNGTPINCIRFSPDSSMTPSKVILTVADKEVFNKDLDSFSGFGIKYGDNKK